MTTITKIAFYDPATDEYYCSEEGFQKLIFKSDISKAKLYTVNSPDFTGVFGYIKAVSRRAIICIDVELTFKPIKVDNKITSTKVAAKLAKLRAKFDPLDAIASIDVDNLSEKDYQTWKKLRQQIKELETG